MPLTCKENDDGSFKPLPIEVYSHQARSNENPPVHKTEGMSSLSCVSFDCLASCTDNVTEVTSLINLTARLDIIPKPRLYKRVDEYGDNRSWADFDVETTLNAAGILNFNLLHAGVSAREESVEVEFV